MGEFYNIVGALRSLAELGLDVAFFWLVLVVGNAILFAVGECKRRRAG